MQAVATRTFSGQHGKFRRGDDLAKLPKEYVQYLIDNSMAVNGEAVKTAPNPTPAPIPEPAPSPVSPSNETPPPTGGPIGGDKPWLSRPAAPPPGKPTSRKRKAAE